MLYCMNYMLLIIEDISQKGGGGVIWIKFIWLKIHIQRIVKEKLIKLVHKKHDRSSSLFGIFSLIRRFTKSFCLPMGTMLFLSFFVAFFRAHTKSTSDNKIFKIRWINSISFDFKSFIVKSLLIFRFKFPFNFFKTIVCK